MPKRRSVTGKERPEAPLESRPTDELTAMLEKISDQISLRQKESRKIRRILRNRKGGRNSGALRASASETRQEAIRQAHADLAEQRERGIIRKLSERFSVSRSTIQRAIRRHKPTK